MPKKDEFVVRFKSEQLDVLIETLRQSSHPKAPSIERFFERLRQEAEKPKPTLAEILNELHKLDAFRRFYEHH